MSYWPLQPSADETGQESLHAWWDGGFTEEELSDIIKMGESKMPTNAIVGQGTSSRVDSEIRRSKTSWINACDLSWLYSKLGGIVTELNGKYFQYDISGFFEDFQYTVYEENDQGFYNWHMDKGYNNRTPPRKLSLSLLLSDPSEFEGGELELLTGDGKIVTEKKKGILHVFPSFVIHKVNPVTRGTRRSLVVWIMGPRWH